MGEQSKDEGIMKATTESAQPITSVEFVCVNRARVERDGDVLVVTTERDLVQVRVTG